MRKFLRSKVILFVVFIGAFTALPARADLFGGDVAVLVKILVESINQLNELRRQSQLMEDEMRGVRDTIRRLTAIKEIVQGTDSSEWKDPRKAVRRLSDIYYTLPPEIRTKKADAVEAEIRRAMDIATRITNSAGDAYKTGADLERTALNKSPAVSQKLTASGVGSLIELQAQNQVAQGTIIGLLTQMVAETTDSNARQMAGRSAAFMDVSQSLSPRGSFSSKIRPPEVSR